MDVVFKNYKFAQVKWQAPLVKPKIALLLEPNGTAEIEDEFADVDSPYDKTRTVSVLFDSEEEVRYLISELSAAMQLMENERQNK